MVLPGFGVLDLLKLTCDLKKGSELESVTQSMLSWINQIYLEVRLVMLLLGKCAQGKTYSPIKSGLTPR